jgi:tyrosinase
MLVLEILTLFNTITNILTLHLNVNTVGKLTLYSQSSTIINYPSFFVANSTFIISYEKIKWSFYNCLISNCKWKAIYPNGCISDKGIPGPCSGSNIIAKSFSFTGKFLIQAEIENIKISATIHVRNTSYRNFLGRHYRREVRTFSTTEWRKLVNSFYTVKDLGIYDLLVAVHKTSMEKYYNVSNKNSNVSHGTPAFLPWHRSFLRFLEIALKCFNNNTSITIPYWNWTIDMEKSSIDNPVSNELWTDNYFGPSGNYFNETVTSGPFCSIISNTCNGRWPIKSYLDGPTLRRNVGFNFPLLPDLEDVGFFLSQKVYDSPPFSTSTSFHTFRASVEGWITVGHNSVHHYVGGSMEKHSSPNDPVFWFHHSFVNKIWLDWQRKTRCYKECWVPSDSPDAIRDNIQVPNSILINGIWRLPGQHWSDNMWPWSVSIKDFSDIDSSTDYYLN